MSTGDIGVTLNTNIDTLTVSVNEYIDLVNKAIANEQRNAVTIQQELSERTAIIETAKAQNETYIAQLQETTTDLSEENEAIKTIVNELEKDIEKLKTENTETKVKILELTSENDVAFREITTLQTENENLQKEINAKTQLIEAAALERIAQYDFINVANQKISALEGELASENANKMSISSELEQAKTELEQAQKELEQKQKEYNEQNREYDKNFQKLTQLYGDAEARAEELDQKLQDAKKEIDASKTMNENEKQKQQRAIDELMEKTATLKKNVENSETLLENIETQRKNLQESNERMTQTTAENTAEIEKLKSQLNDANNKIVQLMGLVSAAKQRLSGSTGNSGPGNAAIPTGQIPIASEGMSEAMELPESAVSPLLQTNPPESINKYTPPVNIEDTLRTDTGIKPEARAFLTENPLNQPNTPKNTTGKTAQLQPAQPPSSAAKIYQPANKASILAQSKSAVKKNQVTPKSGGTKKKKYLKKHNSKTSKRKSKSTTKKIHKRFHKTNKHTKNNKRH